ncbi:MAG: hypothetical protein NC037_00255 [Bacteroides sp.]|nr:hypothetical protein [Bacillota bacterium]MCM1393750.1 hypothetical protein [[Eubacterium] siraeum]MCM1454949.1 hypothetical protein [Bacteroides sp.]
MKEKRYYKGFAAAIAYKIFPQPEVIFEEPIPDGETVVFTANHSGAYGPVNATLYFPHPSRPWTVAEILDKKLSADFIFYDFFAGAGKKCKFFWHVLSHLVAVLLRPLLLRAGGIPVYHDRRVTKTFEDSVAALKGGEHVVIFPECPERFSEHINDFYGGFAKLGLLYYKETGKNLKFYPTYIAHPLKKILVGKPVEFNPDDLGAQGRKQITEQLRDRTEELAKSLPPHKVQPFLTEEWYRAYEKYWKEGRMLDYWQLCEKRGKKRKKNKSAED